MIEASCKRAHWGPRYIGVFLLSAATLMLQISYTRILSVALWHHFVWMIVSIALFGYAASGTLLSVHQKFLKSDVDRMLTISSALFSVSALISYGVLNHVPFDPSKLAWDRLQILYVSAYYLLLSIPFFFSGLTMALSVVRARNRINGIYFSSLLGSAIGSISTLPLFPSLTGPGVMVFTSIIAGASTLTFALNLNRRSLVPITGWILTLLLILPYSGGLLPVRISPFKSLMVALRYPNATLIETDWNAFSRVDVIRSGYVRHAPGLSLHYGDPIPDQIGVTVDGDSLDAITRFDGKHSSLAFTSFLPTSLPYQLLVAPRVLVVDAGGGLDVLTALHHNSSRIEAVEVNPIIVEHVQENYDIFSGNIYRNERVTVSVSEGRSFIQGSKEEYDIIVISMTDSASASSTGIYALSENYIYTIESFREFISHLSKGGFFSVSRWILPPPREDVRIVSIAISALNALGIQEPSEHIAVIRSWGTITLLVGRSKLDTYDVAAIKEFCIERGFDIVHVPGIEPWEVNKYNRFPEPIYYNLVKEMLHSESREALYRSYLYDIGPASDERPFFFHFFKWNRLLKTYENLGRKWQPLIEGGFLVPLALVQASLLSIIFILLPLRRIRAGARSLSFLTYFFCLGLGYMFIEVALIQKFILLLGHPAYSASAVLFSLLLASGIGSYVSGRFRPSGPGHKIILLATGVLSSTFGFASPAIKILLSLPITSRLLVTPFIIAPLGFIMGMPFPIGVRMQTRSGESLISWAWAANGCSSVLGAILPTILATSLGFSRVFIFAGAAYFTGLCMIFHYSSIQE